MPNMIVSTLCRLTGLERGRVDTWVSDGDLFFDMQVKNGQTRHLTKMDALRLLVFAEARAIGLSTSRARDAIHMLRGGFEGYGDLFVTLKVYSARYAGAGDFAEIDPTGDANSVAFTGSLKRAGELQEIANDVRRPTTIVIALAPHVAMVEALWRAAGIDEAEG